MQLLIHKTATLETIHNLEACKAGIFPTSGREDVADRTQALTKDRE